MDKNSIEEQESPFSFGQWFDRIGKNLTGRAEDLVGHWFASVERGVEQLLSSILKRLSVFFFVLLGATFLFVGCARLLDQMYGLPGIGYIIIGAVIFALLLILVIREKYVTKKIK